MSKRKFLDKSDYLLQDIEKRFFFLMPFEFSNHAKTKALSLYYQNETSTSGWFQKSYWN